MPGLYREDTRPPEVKQAADRIALGVSTLAEIYFFRCLDCGQSGSDQDFKHSPDCKTGKVLESYRKTLPF